MIMVPPDLEPVARNDLLRRFGTVVRQLDGEFFTGPDVGTSSDDMDVIAATGAPYVFSRTPAAGGAGDPGPFTALGVFTGIATSNATCVKRCCGSSRRRRTRAAPPTRRPAGWRRRTSLLPGGEDRCRSTAGIPRFE